MAEVLLFHHIQGLTAGVLEFAEHLRHDGHVVHVPDLFDGRTFDTIEDGFAFTEEVGVDRIRARGVAAAEPLPAGLVYGGFSYGVTVAQRLAQTRPGARGALLLHACLPVTEFSPTWPAGVPAQIHGMTDDEFFDEDLAAARSLAASTPEVELFEYPGDRHLFTDSSLPAYEPATAAVVLDRTRSFLGSL